MILKKAIAGWYYSFRLISIMVMLVLLVFIGVKLAMQSAASEKALYKRVLVDWVVGMILVFSIHYIMLFIIQFNEILVTQISKFVEADQTLEVYEYGLIERADTPPTNAELESSLYEEVRTRAYDARMTVGFTGMIMYMVLVFYAWKYTFIYLKRYLTIAVLVIVAPIIALTYAFNKVQTGKSQIFTTWLKEFSFTVILQSVHAILYVVFVDTALQLSLSSIAGMIIAFVSLHFVGKAEQIFRKIFNIQGNLANEVANSSLAEIGAGLATVKGANKLRKQFSKGALSLTTKPLRSVGNAAFGKVMEKRANGGLTDAKDIQARKDGYELNSDLKDAKQADSKRKGRIAAELLGNNLKNAMSTVRHPFNKDKRKHRTTIKDLEKNLDNMKHMKGKMLLNEFGEEYEVTDELIAEKEEQLNELKEVDNNKLGAIGRRVSSGTRGALRNILNPYQYVELGEDGKYHRLKTEHVRGRFSKTTDSVGKRFAAHFQLDKEVKDALKPQAEMVTAEITGFLGVLVGLPALIAEPKLAAPFLYAGIGKLSKVHGKSQNFKDVKIIPAGQKFTLKGFAGASEKTIANTALEMARDQIVENEHKVYKRRESIARKIVRKASGGKLGKPKTRTVSSKYKVVKLSKTQAAYVNTKRIINKINADADEKQFKSADDFVETLADKYYEMEADKNKAAFKNLYLSIAAEKEKEVDEMNIVMVQHELGDSEPLQFEERADGTKKLAGDMQRQIIDKAIIESAQKTGIMDISEFSLSASHIEKVKEVIKRDLHAKKELGAEADIMAVIDNLDEQIKNRHAKLAAEGTKPVEERIADQAILDTMRTGNVSDPEKVTTEAVMERYQELCTAVAGGPTKKTASVTESMQAERTTISNIETSSPKQVVDQERAKQIISARQTHFSTVSKNTNKAQADELREKLKRKREVELNATILEAQDNLVADNPAEAVVDGTTTTNTSDAILQLLNYQTEMHKSYELVEARSKEKKEKLKAFKAELFDSRTSIEVKDGNAAVVLRDGTQIQNDGSRKVSTSDGSRRIENVLLEIKRNRQNQI